MPDEQKQRVLAACAELLDESIGVPGVDGEFFVKWNTKQGGLVNLQTIKDERKSLTNKQRSSN